MVKVCVTVPPVPKSVSSVVLGVTSPSAIETLLPVRLISGLTRGLSNVSETEPVVVVVAPCVPVVPLGAAPVLNDFDGSTVVLATPPPPVCPPPPPPELFEESPAEEPPPP